MNLYWGDIHNHCGISYGYGSLENALVAAREHLDFCSVTGHAYWPDMPPRSPRLEFMVDFHERGFAKLARNWDKVRQTLEAANLPHQFVTFHGYEAHSRKYGDHHLLSPSADLPIIHAESPAELVASLAPRPVIAIPHHVAYVPGYRGINWEAFSSAISPVVEVYSKHGCSMSDRSPYPYLHTMGPRDSRNTVRAGLALGHRFGYVASTDHHAGYPGSYGDGRLAVLAKEKTRQAIWKAIVARHTYAVTGDKIACRFQVNGANTGSEVGQASPRQIELQVTACDWIDKIVVYKNSRPWRAVYGENLSPSENAQAFKVRVEMGWGRSSQGLVWNGEAAVCDGLIASVEPCFRGQSVLAPTRDRTEDLEINALRNQIIGTTAARVEWQCTTFKNPSTLHPQTAAVILEIQGDAHTVLNLRLNGKVVLLSIGELLGGSRATFIEGYGSEAFLIHRAIPETRYRFRREWTDANPEADCDIYDVEIRQVNNQWAWLSPVYVLS